MSENIKFVKTMLLILDEKLDKFFEFCESRITDAIKDFCNIENIPERLNSLVQEFLIEQYVLNKNGVGEGKIIASSASDNGQNVNFKIIGGAEEMSKNAKEFIKANEDELINYRKPRWG